ncbi:MAG: 23S rRNA (guanosine(2251)-2'-O)-methyltransferase RlmB [Gammaproteobacteria bacterium]|nr:23S rRNA (guanosine(2251)-2'-O)-methyltransferase RlmB [Gammaproteobacteria bacterium]NNM20410.1 23S rRNA (guanosine(2251)-2'-O)-methyltransferase RlmB [Gammaproteobacteria bacterium]
MYGVHAVSRALKEGPRRVTTLYLQAGRDDATTARLRNAAAAHEIAVEVVAKHRLAQMTGSGKHQGVAAFVDSLPPLGERQLEALVDDLETPFLLALDGVQDPHNLGACLRSAVAAGVDAVIVPRDRAVGITAAVRKVAAGAAEAIAVAQVANLSRVLRMLAKKNVWCYGAAAAEGRELYQLDLRGPLCLVLGGESDGLRRLTREHCDELFNIPMAGDIESLNVSVAAGICLFEALRQRRAG